MSRPPGERREAGHDAEEAVCSFLRDRGIRVVARNVRSRDGEIDIVAREGEAILFVEVRSRERGGFALPEETVTPAKRRRIAAAARAYLRGIPPGSWREARFDVAAVEGEGERRTIRYLPGAFDGRGNPL